MQTLVAVKRNKEGIKEEKYLYALEDFLEKENNRIVEVAAKCGLQSKINKVTKEDLVTGYESSLAANDTFCAKILEDKKAILFVTENNGFDSDNPTISELNNWYSEFKFVDMYTGEINPLSLSIVGNLYFGDLKSYDSRFNELIRLGMPKADFSKPWANQTNYSEVKDALIKGTYNTLIKVKTMNFLVQLKYDDGKYGNRFMSANEVINTTNEMDFNGVEEMAVYKIDAFGEVSKLKYKGWQPECLIQYVDRNENIIISGYGEDH